MPKKFIHPMLYQMRVVLRDGRSYLMSTPVKRQSPYFCQVDVTNHPQWTGGEVVTQDDGQVARFKRRFQHQMEPEEKGPQGSQQ